MTSEKGKSPYAKYNKAPFDYSAMYARNPHLRMRPAMYKPEVGQPPGFKWPRRWRPS